MGVYKVFDGINWVDICDCNVHVKALANWQLLNANDCALKYWDGTQWCEVNCGTPPGPCDCPEGFFLDPTTELCTRVTQEPATPSGGTVYELYKPPINSVYGDFGVRLYNDISGRPYPINAWRNTSLPYTGFGSDYKACESAGLGADIGIQATCSSATLGPVSRQNTSLLWAKLPGSNPVPSTMPPYIGGWPDGNWFSVEYCIEIDKERQFIFALAGDNQIRAKINSTTFNGGGLTNIVNLWCDDAANGSNPTSSITETFRFWHAFPITLPAGTHRLILDGYNISSAFGFGAEIYSVDETFMANDIMTGAANVEDYLLFSTRQLVTVPPLLTAGPGQVITWTCPDGSTTFSDCYGAPSCVIIETTDCI